MSSPVLGEILEKARRMVDEELRYAEELEKLSGEFRHPVLQALIRGIAMDSRKHSVFYAAIVDLIEKTQPFLSDEEYKRIAEGIEKHIEMEAEMVRLTKELADKTEDPRIKMLLLAIHRDEVHHHKLLVDLREKLAKKEVFGEEELWEAVWKDSPWHGTPGG